MSVAKNNIIDLIMTKTKLKQMDIAKKLGVSRAQISKWKSGEDIPYNRQKALNEMAGLFGDSTDWALLTKTPENAENWINYFSNCHESLDVDPCDTFSDTPEVWVPSMLGMFNKIGIKIPEKAPDWNHDDEEDEQAESAFNEFIIEYLEAYSALTNWCQRYLGSIDQDDLFEEVLELEAYIVEYSIAHVDQSTLTKVGADLSKVQKTIVESKKKMTEIIENILEVMLNKNIPIMQDYFDLINQTPYYLDDELMLNSIERSSKRNSTIIPRLPLFERTLLKQNEMLCKVIQELHIKIDTLIKPEDKEKLSKILGLTPPLNLDEIKKD